MKISPARVAAFEALKKISRDRAFSSIVLPAVEENLSVPDRGLCHEVVMGTLRNQFLLDCYIDSLSENRKLDADIRVILRISIYQVLFLDRIPHHAVVNDAVNLALRAKKASAKGFVNAILRSLLRQKPDLSFRDEVERTSIETSHPRWLLERWSRRFGGRAAESIARANNTQPRLTVRGTAKNPIPSEAQLAGDPRALAESGEIYVQDEGSQMVAAAVPIRPGYRVLDVCAAPGSKTTMLAMGHGDDGTLIVAGELHSARVRQLKSAVLTQGARAVSVVQYDAERGLPFEEGSFDVALVDAPCTGTGTIRHNPELRYLLREEDIDGLSDKQLAILTCASKLVRRGGTIVYSTCSLEFEEDEGVCGRFLEANPGWRLVKSMLPERFQTAEGFARTFPDRDDMDGFFVATFEKVQ